MNIKTNRRGVTIVEVLIVLVVGLILVVVFAAMVSNKKSQLQNVYKNEARVVIKDIINKQRMYYARTGSYIEDIPETDVYPELDIDLRRNEYFKKFRVRINTSAPYSPLNPYIEAGVVGASGAAGMIISGTYDNANTQDDKIKFSY